MNNTRQLPVKGIMQEYRRLLVRTLLLPCLAVGLAACASQTTVVLLPDDDGTAGHVIVANNAGTVEITEAGTATTISSRDSEPALPTKIPASTIEQDFGLTLAALPKSPQHILLYFRSDSVELTKSSLPRIDEILQAINVRDSRYISVVGHTDRAGNASYNLKLSARRAAAIAKLLVQYGISREHIHTTSHGENNPLIDTADGIAEPKNRRVEVVVR